MASFADVMNTDWYQYDKRSRHWYEYTSYAFVHYLAQGENGFNATAFIRYSGCAYNGRFGGVRLP